MSTSTIQLGLTNPLYQSGYTYLQAVGSDGTDNTVSGRHLKWDFLKLLGDQHLPKGDYTDSAPYDSTAGFNREDDFVRLYRYKYTGIGFHVTLNTSSTPASIVQVDGKWNWVYNLVVDSMSSITTTVRLIFADTNMYSLINAAMSPLTDYAAFINRYPGIIEVHADDKLAFYYEMTADFGGDSNKYVRTEVVSTPDSLDPATKQLNVRKKFVLGNDVKFYSENSLFMRFDTTANISQIKLITYQDFIAGVNAGARDKAEWEAVGEFALTTETTLMETRFGGTAVDGKWPKFNDYNVTTGRSMVKYNNYNNRWERSGYTFSPTDESSNDKEGLRHFVHTYMKKSTTDPKAIVVLPSDSTSDDSVQVVSCLDMLKLLSLDFHLSRIMGLGHIDADTSTDKYVYCMEYFTTAALEAPLNSAATRSHLYMTLPTGKTDFRLPKAPKLDELTFGASIDNGTDEPSLLTDANGYAPQEKLRFININRAPYNHERAFGSFFYDPTEFVLADESQPVAYGLEYKEVSEAAYRVPELNNDPAYTDPSGIAETIPILENGGPRLFTHQEEEEGTHVYASYAINWFSRVSPLSNTKQAATAFPKISRLLPPSNYATHLIQDEDPAEDVISEKVLVLTTQQEQTTLAAIPESQDQTLVRTTFDWNQAHNTAHPMVDYAEFFFREDEPLVVKGKILSVELIDNDTAIISTTSYQVTSSFPAETVQPTIAAGDVSKFEGSLLSTGQTHYAIESITVSGDNPKFKVKALKQTQPMAPDPDNQNQFFSQESIELPNPGDLFFVIENMTQPSNWDLKHTERVYIEKHYTNERIGLRYSPTRLETFRIRQISEVGSNTIITLHDPRKSSTAGPTLEYAVRKRIVGFGVNSIIVEGNIVGTGYFPVGKTFRIYGHSSNDGSYTASGASSYNSSLNKTTIIVLETIPDYSKVEGIVDVIINRAIAGGNLTTITIAGLRAAEINIPKIEYLADSAGRESRLVAGGIVTDFTFEPLLDELGNGTGYIQLFSTYNLRPHPSLSVEWYKGTVRLYGGFGTSPKIYPVSYIGNLTDTPWTGLALVIQDPGFLPATPSNTYDYYTIDLNATQSGNFHPSYRTYLRKSNGLHPVTNAAITSGVQFKEGFMLPEMSNPLAGSKQTLMSVRSMDLKNNLYSYLSPPSTLLAQKITIPMPPALPEGPLYATRPDFYGKSTYTFDTKVDTSNGRFPYAMIFYRCSNDAILDMLYKKDTQASIFEAWDLLPASFRLDPNLWRILIDATPDAVNPDELKKHVTTEGEFTWPLPDSPKYYVPFESSFPLSETNPDGGLNKPFKDAYALTDPRNVYGKTMNYPDLIRMAVKEAFTPMNEQPPLGAYIKEGKETLPEPTVLRDTNGKLLDPLTNDLYPMIRKYTDGGDTYFRFTDYNLDGASISLYFYRAMELDDKYKFSAPSPTLGPVKMVNSFAPDKPQIRKALTRLQDDVLELPSAIVFELNSYSVNDQITHLEIYRTTDELDALSVRTMRKVKTIAWGDPVEDDFSDVNFPLYGETLYYRLVAIRVVEDVTNTMVSNTPILVEVPSQPSDVFKTGLVDSINPEAPELAFEFDSGTDTYEEIEITWSATCYNGKYSLQKLNNSGNWTELERIEQPVGVIIYPIPSLPSVDEDGNTIYHRFRVEVENSSGLFNLVHKEYILEETDLVQQDYGEIDLEDESGDILV